MSKDKLVNEIDAELKKSPGVGALVNEQTGQVHVFMAPRPYWVKNDATAPEGLKALERERADLIASLPRLAKSDRAKIEHWIRVIEGDLKRARSNDEAERRSQERQQERPQQRSGSPAGNESTSVNWSGMSMADQTDVIQAACRELRRAGAA